MKPELFTDERLWDLGVDTGLPVLQAFIGLWCFADREGRFEWRPRALRAMILPFWEGDMASVLDALASRSFITRYVFDGSEYGHIRTFAAHQVIPHREAQSTLPDPALHGRSSEPGHCTGTAVQLPGSAPGEGKGREGKGREGRGNARERGDATSLHRERRVALPGPDGLGCVTEIPNDWLVTEEFAAEALLAGVTRDYLEEDVRYWRARRSLGGEFRSVEDFIRLHFPRLAKKRETDSFKATRRGPDDALQRQADRVEMLRAQEAEEERRAAGGGSL